MSEWQHIETADHSVGSVVLGFIPNLSDHWPSRVAVIVRSWGHDGIQWEFAHDTEGLMDTICEPTHWMPLPEPPKPKLKGHRHE